MLFTNFTKLSVLAIFLSCTMRGEATFDIISGPHKEDDRQN
jgi:hypothetical protein